jgi:hypothetical protein
MSDREERPAPESSPGADREPATQEYAGGEIHSYHGGVNRWLLVVYAGLAVWGVYYLVRFWGGLGPGLAR